MFNLLGGTFPSVKERYQNHLKRLVKATLMLAKLLNLTLHEWMATTHSMCSSDNLKTLSL